MLIVIISTASGIVFLILRDTANVIDTRFTETYNATGPSATGDYFPLLHYECRHIAGPNATGSFIMQMCICNIFRVESFIRFSPHGHQYITHTNSVRHKCIFIFEDASRRVFYNVKIPCVVKLKNIAK